MIVVDSAGREIGVENHEVQTVEVEGVVGRLRGYVCVFDVAKELRLGDAVKVVIAKDMIGRTFELLKYCLNSL